MAETKTITLDVNSNLEETNKSVNSLKAQLRQAQAEVANLSDKFGATSKEAVEAAKRAAELKDKIGDAKALTDAFNPDAKFNALTASLSGAAGGLTAITGAMGLLGGESKDVEKMILRVQSAMAVSQGIQALGEARDSFKQLFAVVQSFSIVQKISTAAQWLWNAAMAANPLGAIVLVITAVIAAGYKLITMFQESSKAAELNAIANSNLASELKNLEKASKKANQESELSRTRQLGLAKANGESSESIRKLTLQLAKQEEAEKLLNAQRAQKLYFQAQARLLDDEENEAAKENVKKAKEQYQSMFEDYRTAALNVKKVRIQNEIDEAQERTNANKKAQEDLKKHNEDLAKIRKDAAEKAAAERKLLKEKEQKENEDYWNDYLRISSERQKQDFDNRVAFEDADAQLTNDIAADNLKKLNKSIEDEKAAAEAKKEIRASEIDAARGLIGLLSGLAEKNKGIQKAALIANSALSIAEIINNTNVGSSKEVATKGVFGLSTSAILYAKMGISIASVLAATAKGLSALGGGSAGGGGGASTGGGGGTAPAAPSFNVVGNGGANQIAGVMQQQGMQPVQAYVVANNVTTAQGLNRNIINNATLG